MGQWIKTDFGSIAFLDNHDPFPNTDQALIEPNGLIAISKTLEAEKIIEAYKQGIFPWFNQNEPSLNVETLVHPTEIPDIKFDHEKFLQNPNKKIVQIGGWLRNPYSIYRIQVPELFQKAHLIGKNMENYVKPDVPFINLLGNCFPNIKPVPNISSDMSV